MSFGQIFQRIEIYFADSIRAFSHKDSAGQVDGERGCCQHQWRTTFRITKNDDLRWQHLETRFMSQLSVIKTRKDYEPSLPQSSIECRYYFR